MLSLRLTLISLTLLLIPSALLAEPRRANLTEDQFIALWDDMARPPVEWIVLRELTEKAEAEKDPTARIYQVSEAQQHLDDYLAATSPDARMSAKDLSTMTERLTRLRDSTLADLRRSKETERQTAALALATPLSLTDLVKRITSNNPPIPFTPPELLQLSNVPPFLSGPHIAKFDPKYVETFGHYNPAFLKWVNHAISTLDAVAFQEIDPIFQEHLAYHAEYLLGARYYLLAHPDRAKDLARSYKAALGAKRPFNPLQAIPYVEGSFDGQYLAYWLRREIDGTAIATQEIVELVLSRFKPATLLTLRRSSGRASQFVLTIPGTYHSDELELADGEHVFALVLDGTSTKLVADQAKLELTHDPIMDENGKATGKSISLASKRAENVMILRGDFKAGAVATVLIPPLRECLNGCALKLGNQQYTPKVASIREQMPETLNEEPEPGFLLEISQGAATKQLRDVRGIVWAGDLDRDGKLDLIYDDRFHYNIGTSLHLLLSSGSRNELLTEVSHCLSVGC